MGRDKMAEVIQSLLNRPSPVVHSDKDMVREVVPLAPPLKEQTLQDEFSHILQSSPSVELLQRECLMSKSEFPLPKLAFEETSKAIATAATVEKDSSSPKHPTAEAKPEPLFTKRTEASTSSSGKPPSTFSWQETNMGLEELTRTSHVQAQHAVQSRAAVAQHEEAKPPAAASAATATTTTFPDSLNNIPQETEEKFYDSISNEKNNTGKGNNNMRKKVVASSISFNDSFSSDDDDLADDSIDAEPDIDVKDSLEGKQHQPAAGAAPLAALPSAPVVHHHQPAPAGPMIYTSGSVVRNRPAATVPPPQQHLPPPPPQNKDHHHHHHPNLVKLATERMKRTFMGWN